MLNHDGNFSYDSDVRWLAEQARPYYYGIILVLIFFNCYNLALFYALAALTLIWEVDEVDRIDEDLEALSRESADMGINTLVNLEIMMDYLENLSVDPFFSKNQEMFVDYFKAIDELGLSSKDPNFFLLDSLIFDDNNLSDIKSIVKMDDKINTAVLYREDNRELLKAKLMEFKSQILATSNPIARAKVKARMKKLLQLSSQFDEDLLTYKISMESHNIVV